MELIFDIIGKKKTIKIRNRRNQAQIVFSFDPYKTTRVKVETDHHSEDDLRSGLFDIVNDYMLTLPEETKDRLFAAYSEVTQSEMEKMSSTQAMLLKGQAVIQSIRELIDWPSFYNWCYEHGDINFDACKKDSLNEKDFKDITYLTDAQVELVIFSTYIKLLLPVWCSIFENTAEAYGKHKLLLLLCETSFGDMLDTPPNVYTTLRDLMKGYKAHFIDSKMSTEFLTTMDITEEELPDHLLSFAIWFKIMTFNPRSKNSLIIFIYNRIQMYCDEIARVHAPVGFKAHGASKEDDKPFVDLIGVNQVFPHGVLSLLVFIEQPYFPAMLDNRLAYFSYDEFAPHITVHNYHLVIIALIYSSSSTEESTNQSGVFERPFLCYANAKQTQILIYLAAEWLKLHRLVSLASVILENPAPAEFATRCNMASSIISPTKEQITQLRVVNSFPVLAKDAVLNKDTTEGENMVEVLIAEMLGFAFKTPFNNVKCELVDLLIKCE